MKNKPKNNQTPKWKHQNGKTLDVIYVDEATRLFPDSLIYGRYSGKTASMDETHKGQSMINRKKPECKQSSGIHLADLEIIFDSKACEELIKALKSSPKKQFPNNSLISEQRYALDWINKK